MSQNTRKAAWVILLLLVVSCATTYMLHRNDRLVQKKDELSTELRLTQSKLNREQDEIVNLMVAIDSTVDKYKELESQHIQLKDEYHNLLEKVSPNELSAKEKAAKENAALMAQVEREGNIQPVDEEALVVAKEEKKPVEETTTESVLKTLSFNGKILREGESINLDVKFAPNSDILTDTFEIHELAEFLQAHPTLIIKLSGHTEPNPPSDLTNFEQTSKMHLELSKRRVESVGKFLTTRGVDKNQIRTAYFGGSKPRYAIRKLNRRVELEVISR